MPDTQAGDGSNCSPGNTVLLSDSNNYKFKGSLSIKSYTLGALSDPVFDWSGLTKDLQGHALAQSDINYSAIIVFINLTQEQIEAELTSNTISQSSIEAYVSLDTTGITSARMDQYTLFGNPIGIETEFTASTGVWMLTLASGTTAGSGTRMAAFLNPDSTSTVSQLSLANDSTTLSVNVDLHSLTQVNLQPQVADITVDWSANTVKGDGSSFVASNVDQIMVAHYSSLAVTDLETRFLDLELIADSIWTASLSSGSSANLAQLTNTDGAFQGIDDQGVWLMALQCTKCANPAPPVVTILHACQ